MFAPLSADRRSPRRPRFLFGASPLPGLHADRTALRGVIVFNVMWPVGIRRSQRDPLSPFFAGEELDHCSSRHLLLAQHISYRVQAALPVEQ